MTFDKEFWECNKGFFLLMAIFGIVLMVISIFMVYIVMPKLGPDTEYCKSLGECEEYKCLGNSTDFREEAMIYYEKYQNCMIEKIVEKGDE